MAIGSFNEGTETPEQTIGERTVPDRTIVGLESFEEVTASPRAIAAVSFFLALDCLVDLACRVSHDFFRRPHLYTDLGNEAEDVTGALAVLRARTGADEHVPSQEQRDAIYKPVFGQTAAEAAASPLDGTGDFLRNRGDLLRQVSQYTQRIWTTSEATLAAAVRMSHVPFKQYLQMYNGDGLDWSRSFALSPITNELAYRILRTKGVLAVFSIAAEIDPEWPYAQDAHADIAVEQISTQLTKPDETPITRNVIRDRQRTALYGADAIATVLDYDAATGTPADLELLVTKLYLWEAALRAQAGMPVSAPVAPPPTNGAVTASVVGPQPAPALR